MDPGGKMMKDLADHIELVGGFNASLNFLSSLRHIPRVRIGLRDETSLVVVHTDDGKSLRLECIGKNDHILCKLLDFRGSYKEAAVANLDAILMPFTLMRHLNKLKETVIEVIEWDIQSKEFVERIALNGTQLRAKRINCLVPDLEIINRVKRFHDSSVFESAQAVSIHIADDFNMVPQQAIRSNYSLMTIMEIMLFSISSKDTVCSWVVRYPDTPITLSGINSTFIEDLFKKASTVREPTRVNEHVTCQRIVVSYEEKSIVLRLNKSPCGYWIDAMLQEKEAEFMDNFEKVVCEVGIFCEKCTNPVDYDYYRSLPQRLVKEKDWDNAFLKNDSFYKYSDDLWQRMMMKLNYEKKRNDGVTSPADEFLNLIRDSLTLKPSVPRVRFGAQLGKALLVIHTCDRKFLRLEFDGKKNKTIVKILQNTWDVTKIIEKTVDNSDYLALAVSVLKDLFERKSIVPDVLEWEVTSPELFSRIAELLEDCELAAKKVNMVGDGVAGPLATTRSAECLIVNLGLSSDIFPQQLFRFAFRDLNGSNMFLFRPITNWNSFVGLFLQLSAISGTLSGINSSFIKDEFEQKSRENEPIRVNEEVTCHRITTKIEDRDLVIRMNKSSCGYWIDVMHTEDETRAMEMRKRVVCGLGYLCKKCTDPFEYEYYQSLPQRIVREKEWDSVFTKNFNLPEVSAKIRKQMVEMFESDEVLGEVSDDPSSENESDDTSSENESDDTSSELSSFELSSEDTTLTSDDASSEFSQFEQSLQKVFSSYLAMEEKKEPPF